MNLATTQVSSNAAQVSSIVPAHLKKIASLSQIWEALVMAGASASVASKRMNVSLSDANHGLSEAASRLRTRRDNCERAHDILEASGAVKQEISRRAWDEVALGIRHSA